MPGVAKRKYDAETVRFSQSLTGPLSLIVETMKPGYSREDLLRNSSGITHMSGILLAKDTRFIRKTISSS